MVTSADKEGEPGKPGVGNYEVQTSVYKINKLQGIQPIFYNNYK